MKKKILIIFGHPSLKSFNKEIADAYERGAKRNHQVKTLYLAKLTFDPILHASNDSAQPLEKDLQKAQRAISWADHLVFVYPIWWGAMPALLKGFIDRAFTTGFAYSYKTGKHEKLLVGKTASLLLTSGGATFWYYLIGRLMNLPVTVSVFRFCGIKPRHQKFIGSVRNAKMKERVQTLLSTVETWGEHGI